jgi:hypothetical protein
MKNRVFVSYQMEDVRFALQINNALHKADLPLAVWIDYRLDEGGTHIEEATQEGITASDYYVLLLSKSSTEPEWVKREVSFSLELSERKQLTLIPVLLNGAQVPVEFEGLLYIDARQSFDDGLQKLVKFFVAQYETASDLGWPEDNWVYALRETDRCVELLRHLRLGDLRFLLSKRLTLDDVKVVWFDVFNAQMEDEVAVQSLPQSCVELLDRSRREELLPDLIGALCRNHPRLAELASKNRE